MEQSNAKRKGGHTPKEVVGDVMTVRGKLALLGWKSMKAWADAHGYQRLAVAYTVKTWGLRTDRQPHGGISRAIMKDLRATLDTSKRPCPANIEAC